MFYILSKDTKHLQYFKELFRFRIHRFCPMIIISISAYHATHFSKSCPINLPAEDIWENARVKELNF